MSEERKQTQTERVQRIWLHDDAGDRREPTPRWLSIAMGVGLAALFGGALLSRLVH